MSSYLVALPALARGLGTTFAIAIASMVLAVGFGFVVERFGLFLQMQTRGTIFGGQRDFSLTLGVALMVLGAAVALVSARQFRQFTKNLDPSVVPPGYWTQAGVALNVIVAAVALALVAHIVWSAR